VKQKPMGGKWEKQNRRSHSVNENTNADFRLFAITFIAYCACACG